MSSSNNRVSLKFTVVGPTGGRSHANFTTGGIYGNVLRIGKNAQKNDIVISGDVGQMHAVLDVNGVRNIILSDLGYFPGTQVNKMRISKRYLEEGDVIRIGENCITLESVRLETFEAPTEPMVSPYRQKQEEGPSEGEQPSFLQSLTEAMNRQRQLLADKAVERLKPCIEKAAAAGSGQYMVSETDLAAIFGASSVLSEKDKTRVLEIVGERLALGGSSPKRMPYDVIKSKEFTFTWG